MAGGYLATAGGIDKDLHETGARGVAAEPVAPQVGQMIAHHGFVVIGAIEDPVRFGGEIQEGDAFVIILFIPGFYRIVFFFKHIGGAISPDADADSAGKIGRTGKRRPTGIAYFNECGGGILKTRFVQGGAEGVNNNQRQVGRKILNAGIQGQIGLADYLAGCCAGKIHLGMDSGSHVNRDGIDIHRRRGGRQRTIQRIADHGVRDIR
ncbi:MAG: hypothetical protein BWY71_02144 [Planctomycetes bacterium ADurb.Bin412]|nr:MAG: hypothetical protein BWY71_02144 [Planctomycetes bacterium ADurb.Bin412]